MWTYAHYNAHLLHLRGLIGASFNFDRSQGYEVAVGTGAGAPMTLAYWQRTHPDWIEYQCNSRGEPIPTAPAWEYGDIPKVSTDPAKVPLDIANPRVRVFMFEHYYRPALIHGFPLLFFDNFRLHDRGGRCGHFDRSGHWVRQYSTAPSARDQQYGRDALAWLSYMHEAIHTASPHALLAVNYNPVENQDTPSQYDRVFHLVDVLWEEGGFTDWGIHLMSTATGWSQELQAMRDIASRADKGLILNGRTSAASYSRITPAQRLWVLANYLLVKGDHTYTAIMIDDYGYYADFPEYHIPIGSPVDSPHALGGLYARTFTGGLALVNPGPSRAVTARLPASGYRQVDGAAVGTTITLPPTSAAILLR